MMIKALFFRANLYSLILLTVLLPHSVSNAFADTTIPGDLFLFPDVQITNTSGSGAPDDVEENKIEAGIDLFYSYKDKKFLALIEYVVNRDENEFERLQLGWALEENTVLWAGRYHNILGYWNTASHHGTYLQTSISRPAITEYEDDGGVLPMHTSGFLLSSENIFSNSRLEFDLALGFGPTMESGNLEPMDIFSPGGETYNENFTLRLTYFPGLFSNTQFGLFAGHTRIEGDGVTIREIEQYQSGIFGLFETEKLTLLSSAFFVENIIESAAGAADAQSDFINAYLQLSYQFVDKWTAYTRVENTFNKENDPYLALIPNFVNQREVVGLRFDVFSKHALTLEARQDQVLAGQINYIVLQWSALLP